MADSKINAIIKSNEIKRGEAMRNVHGTEIPGSMVLSDYVIIIRRDGADAGYDLLAQNALTGEETTTFLSLEAMAVLKTVTF